MTKIELPEMPPAVSVALIAGPQGSEYRHLADTWEPDVARHSESQLRARDRQIVELCAQIVSSGDYCRYVDHAQGCCDCVEMAAALRSLIGDQHG